MTKRWYFPALCFVLIYMVLATLLHSVISSAEPDVSSAYRQKRQTPASRYWKNILSFIGLHIRYSTPPSSCRSTPPSFSCLSNLKQIDGATEQWSHENRQDPRATPTWSDLVGTDKYIKRMPVCPSGGIYTLGSATNPPTCTMTNDCDGRCHELPKAEN